MSDISRVALFGKLNPVGYLAIESATVFGKLRGNPYVELEHWLAQLLQLPDSDLHRVIRHAGLDQSVVANDLTRALDRLPRGATSISTIVAIAAHYSDTPAPWPALAQLLEGGVAGTFHQLCGRDGELIDCQLLKLTDLFGAIKARSQIVHAQLS